MIVLLLSLAAGGIKPPAAAFFTKDKYFIRIQRTLFSRVLAGLRVI